MFKKWLELIFDHKISLQERMFRIVTGICMVALMFILPMGRNLVNLLILAVSIVGIWLIVKISIQRKCINCGATLISALLLALFPVSFFSVGGFYSGMPEWFVLCFIYINITLTGRRKAAFFLMCTAETLLCYYIAYYFPQYVAQNTQGHSFFDSALLWWERSQAFCFCF